MSKDDLTLSSEDIMQEIDEKYSFLINTLLEASLPQEVCTNVRSSLTWKLSVILISNMFKGGWDLNDKDTFYIVKDKLRAAHIESFDLITAELEKAFLKPVKH